MDIQVSETTHERAAAIAARHGMSVAELIDAALTAYEQPEFWQLTHEALARHPEALVPDPAWERAMPDGLAR